MDKAKVSYLDQNYFSCCWMHFPLGALLASTPSPLAVKTYSGSNCLLIALSFSYFSLEIEDKESYLHSKYYQAPPGVKVLVPDRVQDRTLLWVRHLAVGGPQPPSVKFWEFCCLCIAENLVILLNPFFGKLLKTCNVSKHCERWCLQFTLALSLFGS